MGRYRPHPAALWPTLRRCHFHDLTPVSRRRGDPARRVGKSSRQGDPGSSDKITSQSAWSAPPSVRTYEDDADGRRVRNGHVHPGIEPFPAHLTSWVNSRSGGEAIATPGAAAVRRRGKCRLRRRCHELCRRCSHRRRMDPAVLPIVNDSLHGDLTGSLLWNQFYNESHLLLANLLFRRLREIPAIRVAQNDDEWEPF